MPATQVEAKGSVHGAFNGAFVERTLYSYLVVSGGAYELLSFYIRED